MPSERSRLARSHDERLPHRRRHRLRARVGVEFVHGVPDVRLNHSRTGEEWTTDATPKLKTNLVPSGIGNWAVAAAAGALVDLITREILEPLHMFRRPCAYRKTFGSI